MIIDPVLNVLLRRHIIGIDYVMGFRLAVLLVMVRVLKRLRML